MELFAHNCLSDCEWNSNFKASLKNLLNIAHGLRHRSAIEGPRACSGTYMYLFMVYVTMFSTAQIILLHGIEI
jgi:hypothetical protein